MSALLPPSAVGLDGTNAIFSEDGNHRLWLRRHSPDLYVDQAYGRILFFLCNPSKAGADENDQTVSKCVGFSKKYGATRTGLVNGFTRISTDPLGLAEVSELNAPEADDMIRLALDWLLVGDGSVARGRLVFAYGKLPFAGSLRRAFGERVRFVVEEAARRELQPFALGITPDLWPRHPSRFGYVTALDHMQPVPPDHLHALTGA